MSWYPKEHITHFDTTPIEGLMFLDGDLLARATHQTWSEKQKYPMIVFPSGMEFSVWQADIPDQHRIRLFGKLELRIEDTVENAFECIRPSCEAAGYRLYRLREDQLAIIGDTQQEQRVITYDPFAQRIANIESFHPLLHEAQRAYIPPLMTDELRRQLPLFTEESDEDEVRVLVNYSLPDVPCFLFASAFDGDDLCFGVFFDAERMEMEWSYFRISDLEHYAVENPLKLPVQRDVSFTPQTLASLIEGYFPRSPLMRNENQILSYNQPVFREKNG